jgi:hypothetical protein
MSNPNGEARELTFTYRNEEVNITYNPEATRQELAALRANLPTLKGEVEQWDALVSALAQMLVSWDVTEHGQPLPITEATLRKLSYPLLLRLINEVAKSLGEDFELRLEVR